MVRRTKLKMPLFDLEYLQGMAYSQASDLIGAVAPTHVTEKEGTVHLYVSLTTVGWTVTLVPFGWHFVVPM
jgi:predicted acyltransferase